MKKLRRVLAVILVMAVCIVNLDFGVVSAAQNEKVTIIFVDNTNEKWIANDDAKMELVDNTNGHDKYEMSKCDDTTWSVEVPSTAYNITFNRYNPNKTELWNSWSAGGRDEKTCYYAEGNSNGQWMEEVEEKEGFNVGDMIYLDVSSFTDWEKNDAKMYINFTEASKSENQNADIYIPSADKTRYQPRHVLNKIGEHVYSYVVTKEDEGSSVLRFWRGNEQNLWNCSVSFSYSQYEERNNCVRITGWDDMGDVYQSDYFVDMDKDDVDDELELLFGTDTTKTDTDGDGLSDYIEIYKSDTDPLSKDSDENGIEDGEEDTDNDGLSNIEEIRIGTDLSQSDTDSDGLKDGDEINLYGTNPICYDTDGDGISDGNEVLLGLDPLKASTDGITPDSNRTFEQQLDDDYIDEELNGEDNAVIPSVSGNVPDNINGHVTLEEEEIYALEDNRAAVGKQVYVDTDYPADTHLQLHFDCSSEDERKSFFLICKYEDGEIIPCETEQNSDDIWTTVTTGYYFVMDTEKMLMGLDIPINEYKSAEDVNLVTVPSSKGVRTGTANEVSKDWYHDNYTLVDGENNPVEDSKLDKEILSEEGMHYVLTSALNQTIMTAETVREENEKISGQADIVFVVDSTGSMSDAIYNVAANIDTFIHTLSSDYSVKANFALIDFKDITNGEKTTLVKNGSSNWFTDATEFKKCINSIYVEGGGDDLETPIDGLAMAYELDFRKDADKFVILITDADYKNDNNYGIASMDEMTGMFSEAGIVTSVISGDEYESNYHNLYSTTNGVFGNIYGDFSSALLKLADNIGEIVNDGIWVILSDYQHMKLNAAEISDNSDSDEDGLSDYEELGTAVKKDLTPFIKTVLSGYGVPYECYKGKTSVTVYQYKSNPILSDSDFDGIPDGRDTKPLNNQFKGRMHYKLDKKVEICNVEFSVDYRDFFENNKKYLKKLSVLSSLYASDIYKNLYIEVTDGAKGGSDNQTDFGKIFGLKDAENIKIEGTDYSVDKDDVTEFFVGHRLVKYKGQNREIIILSIRGTNGTNAEWSSNFDVGADTNEYYNIMGKSHPDWKNKGNHKGFDVAANRVLDKFNAYLARHGLNSSNVKKSLLITGHSRGAAIANLLGAHFEKDVNFRSYTYTFAAPNCTTDSKAGNYHTIMNVLNTDDLIPYLPLGAWGFKKYGKNYKISVKDKYESVGFMGKKGTWEWLIKRDYNSDGGTARTIRSFKKVASNREQLYRLDTSSDGKVNIGNKYHTTRKGAEKRLVTVRQKLKGVKLYRLCKLKVVGGGLSPYHVEVNYCPAYLMQNLANMASKTGPKMGYDTRGVYAQAKASFIASSGKIKYFERVGGMTDPHMQPTYYLIAYNNFKSIK